MPVAQAVHAASERAPIAVEKRPAVQLLHTEEEEVKNAPGVHTAHASSDEVEPPGREVKKATRRGAAASVAASKHAVHAVAPVALEKVPPAHELHTSAAEVPPEVVEYWPAPHSPSQEVEVGRPTADE